MWKAVQRYDDGEEAAWIGPPDSDHPAPVTVVSEDAARVNAGGEGAEAEPAAGEEDQAAEPASAPPVEVAAGSDDDGGGSAPAIVLGGIGCALGLAALVVALRRRPA